MANIVFATPELLRSATITSGPRASTTPVSNLLAREPSDALILTDPDAAWIAIDWGSTPPDIRLAAVLYGNAGSWRVRADATDPTDTPTYDSGTLVFGNGEAGLRHRRYRTHDWLWWETAKTLRYWRIDFSNPDDDEDRTIVGAIVLDEGIQPAINQVYGGNIGLIDPSRKPRSVEGRVEPLERRPYMGVEGSLEWGSEDEMFGDLLDLDEISGTVRPVLYLRDPAATAHRQKKAVYGLFETLAPVTDAYFQIHSKRFQIAELLP